MARIRKVEIENYRGIRSLEWCPSVGISCLIGPGDSGKSSVLDAIDRCLGARRSVQFTDADFYRLDVETPISISVTLGALDDALMNLENYGLYLRGFDPATGKIEDEPEQSTETVLTLRLTVASDLEPSWSLVSERAQAQDQTRNLSWGDRVRLAPTRIGAAADYHLGWARSSILNRISEEKADASAALAGAARDARAAFGDQAEAELHDTLGIVAQTGKELGVPTGEQVRALLDAHSVSFSQGTISLHDEDGIPLRGLGTGSTRLLISGLQRKAASRSSIVLIDELEHGLEPHRIIRLLGSLGSKESTPPLQAFVTTHSPVVLRELSGSQLFVLRGSPEQHAVVNVGTEDDIQSTIRLFPDAFLAPSVVVCEGASEVGLIRGLDLFRTAEQHAPIGALGGTLVDSGGGSADRPFQRASAFQSLGYRVAVLRDDDKPPTPGVEQKFIEAGGKVFTWREGRALEDELFLSLSETAVTRMISFAEELHGTDLVDQHIKSMSEGATDLSSVKVALMLDHLDDNLRRTLGKAARTRKAGWFKSISWMEQVASEIVGPNLANAEADFRILIDSVFEWIGDAGP